MCVCVHLYVFLLFFVTSFSLFSFFLSVSLVLFLSYYLESCLFSNKREGKGVDFVGRGGREYLGGIGGMETITRNLLIFFVFLFVVVFETWFPCVILVVMVLTL